MDQPFRAVCARAWGIDHSAAGLPTSNETALDGERARQPRIARLLSLAESQNVHEAERDVQEAQRFLLKYNLRNPDGRCAPASISPPGERAVASTNICG